MFGRVRKGDRYLNLSDWNRLVSFAKALRKGITVTGGGTSTVNKSGVTLNIPKGGEVTWTSFNRIMAADDDRTSFGTYNDLLPKYTTADGEIQVLGNLPNPIGPRDYSLLHIGPSTPMGGSAVIYYTSNQYEDPNLSTGRNAFSIFLSGATSSYTGWQKIEGDIFCKFSTSLVDSGDVSDATAPSGAKRIDWADRPAVLTEPRLSFIRVIAQSYLASGTNYSLGGEGGIGSNTFMIYNNTSDTLKSIRIYPQISTLLGSTYGIQPADWRNFNSGMTKLYQSNILPARSVGGSG